MRDLCDIAAIPMCKVSYMDNLKNSFSNAMYELDAADRPKGKALPAESELAAKGIAAMLASKGRVRIG